MLKIRITNLSKYNEGILVSKWIKLPVTNEEFNNVLKEIGINEKDEGYLVSDYESDINDLEVGECADIEDLNDVASSIEKMNAEEKEIYSVLLGESCSPEEAIDKIEGCIFYEGCNDMSDVAEQYVTDMGILKSIPESLRDYFDYVKYGQYMEASGNFIRTDSGYVQIL